MIDFEKALDYVKNKGNDFQKKYLKALLMRNNGNEAIEYLARYQNADGGFIGLDTDYVGKASSITCTMIALGKFERLRLNSGSVFDSTVLYLKRQLKRKGMWDESIGVLESQPPSWYYPKNSKNQVWFTNGILRYLVSGRPQEYEMISKARAFLRQFWDGNSFLGYEHNNWMGIVGFYNGDDPIDIEIHQRCMKNVKTQIHKYDLSDVNWALESFMSLGFSQTNPIVAEGLALLVEGQGQDGGFVTGYGDLHRVDTTIDALDTFAYYGIIPINVLLHTSKWL